MLRRCHACRHESLASKAREQLSEVQAELQSVQQELEEKEGELVAAQKGLGVGG
jgi:hypothetical protein